MYMYVYIYMYVYMNEMDKWQLVDKYMGLYYPMCWRIITI